MYANILLSTDGSEVAKRGVENGMALAKALNAKVTVISVTESLPIDLGSGHASGWIPTQDEWMKAAHYDPNRYGAGQGGWWLYSHRSDVAPVPGVPIIHAGAVTSASRDETSVP